MISDKKENSHDGNVPTPTDIDNEAVIKKKNRANDVRRNVPRCIGCGLCALGCPLGRDGPPESNN